MVVVLVVLVGDDTYWIHMRQTCLLFRTSRFFYSRFSFRFPPGADIIAHEDFYGPSPNRQKAVFDTYFL